MYDFKSIEDYSFELDSEVLTFWNTLQDQLVVLSGKRARLVIKKIIDYQDQ